MPVIQRPVRDKRKLLRAVPKRGKTNVIVTQACFRKGFSFSVFSYPATKQIFEAFCLQSTLYLVVKTSPLAFGLEQAKSQGRGPGNEVVSHASLYFVTFYLRVFLAPFKNLLRPSKTSYAYIAHFEANTNAEPMGNLCKDFMLFTCDLTSLERSVITQFNIVTHAYSGHRWGFPGCMLL